MARHQRVSQGGAQHSVVSLPFGFHVKYPTINVDGFVKSRRCCHCERSEAISLAVTA